MRTERRLPLLTLLFVAGLAGCATTAVHRPVLEARIRAQADAWDRAIVGKDAAAIAANMAESFRHIDSYGKLQDKAQFVAGILSDQLTIAPYTPEDVEIRCYGDVAIVTGTTLLHGTYNGKSFTTHYRYTDTYAKEQGGWHVVSVQTTEIAP
jgi:ketosteroid isomerase-like protein